MKPERREILDRVVTGPASGTPALSELDDGIRDFVRVLMANGIETYESCQGGPGHCFAEPTVRFFGNQAQGFRALSVAHDHGLPVSKLRRFWSVLDGEPTGPHWELIFSRLADGSPAPHLLEMPGFQKDGVPWR